MQQWWFNLSQREQRLLFGVVGLLIVFFAYQLLWLPLYHANQRAYQRYVATQHLITSVAQMQRSPLYKRITTDYTIRLLPDTEKSLLQAGLSQYLGSISQSDSHSVELVFKQVPFNRWMSWLQHMVTTTPVAIETWHVNRVSAGVCDIKLTLIKR